MSASTSTESPGSRRAGMSPYGDSWLPAMRYDLPASLVVFLVAVPLSLGIAVASDAPLTAGLIAAAVGGIVAGALGGSPLQVSGPAAGLTVIVADLVGRFGWGVTCLITAAAGVLQIILGVTKSGRAALAISPAVVHGMLAGIGATIVLGQIHVMLGGEQQENPVANILAFPGQLLSLAPIATALGLGVIAILLLWPKLPKSVPGWVRGVPAPLLAVAAMTIVAVIWSLPVERVVVGGSVLDALTLPTLPESDWAGVFVGILTIAIIASIESLLSAVAVDRMHSGEKSRLNKELVGQGAGNTVSGMIGGLPITGVIVRSTANVAANARTRNSAILHGLWIVVFSVLLLGLVEQIPMAVLAGLLVIIGIRLINVAHMRELAHHGELPIYVVTLVGVVVTDLLTGVLLGLGLALLLVLRRVVWASIEVQEPAAGDGGEGRWHVVVEGALSFLSIPRLNRALAQVPEGANATIDLVTDYLDHAAYDQLSEWVERQRLSGADVRVDEVGTMGLADRSGSAVARSRLGGPGDRRPGHVPRFFSPWREWQAGHDDRFGPGHGHGHLEATPDASGQVSREDDPILTGLREYHRRAAGLVAPYLSEDSTPHALFLTCTDSRVVPNVLTSSGPGDLVTVRNVGNLAPLTDHTGGIDVRGIASSLTGSATDGSDGANGSGRRAEPSRDDSVGASVEYAVDVLRVPTIVVCGHSGCGAMSAALSATHTDGALGRWLTGADASVTAWRTGHEVGRHAAAEGRDDVDQLAMVNVVVQLERLAEHPSIAPALAEGRVRLVGLFFDIGVARMMVLDSGRFVPASSDRLGAGAAGARVDETPTSTFRAAEESTGDAIAAGAPAREASPELVRADAPDVPGGRPS